MCVLVGGKSNFREMSFIGMIIGALLAVREVGAFSMCTPYLIQRHLFASFPNTPVEKGLKLLNTPEAWAAGAGLAFGIPRFEISTASRVTRVNKERMIQFVVNEKPVTLIAPAKNRLHVLFSDERSMQIRLNHDDGEIGFSIFISFEGLPPMDYEEVMEWQRENRKWVEASLFSLVDDEEIVENFMFQSWRADI